MAEPRSTRPMTVSQVVGILALGVIVFFIVAFASEAIRTYRLRAWRDDLQTEIASMDLDRQNLLLEIGRRQSAAWIDEALKETGRIPPDVTSVRLIPPSGVASTARPSLPDEASGPSIGQRVQELSYFDNENWRAWVRLLAKRD